MSRDNFNKINVVAKRTCKYFFAHILLNRKSINIYSITNSSIIVVTIDNIIIRWFSSSYYVTFICCAIFNLRKTFSLFDDNDFNCFATFNQKFQKTSIHLFIYLSIFLSIYEFYFVIFYIYFVRHDFIIVLIFIVMSLFR